MMFKQRSAAAIAASVLSLAGGGGVAWACTDPGSMGTTGTTTTTTTDTTGTTTTAGSSTAPARNGQALASPPERRDSSVGRAHD